MEQEFNPPRYTWTVATADEAQNVLGAAQDLIGAHLATLVPGRGAEKLRASKTAPVALTVSLDLSDLTEQINAQRAADSMEATLTFGSD